MSIAPSGRNGLSSYLGRSISRDDRGGMRRTHGRCDDAARACRAGCHRAASRRSRRSSARFVLGCRADRSTRRHPTPSTSSKRRTRAGFSVSYDVTGPDGLEWSAKIGPEAQTEVVLSRILWGLGYHQPPIYYLPSWRLDSGDGEPTVVSEARFRPKLPNLPRAEEVWSWADNPFSGTRELKGLLVVLLMLNSTDLKDSNNSIYRSQSAVGRCVAMVRGSRPRCGAGGNGKAVSAPQLDRGLREGELHHRHQRVRYRLRLWRPPRATPRR